MKSFRRIIILMSCDALLVNLAIAVPVIIRFYGSQSFLSFLQYYMILGLLITIIYIAFFYLFNLYNRVWAYASTSELVAIVQAVTLGSFGTIALTYFTYWPLPRSVVIMQWAFTIILIGGSRLAWRVYVEQRKTNGCKAGRRALIIGAGDAGAMVTREFKGHKLNIRPVGFIDDDPNKQRLTVLGLPVLGNREAIPQVVKKLNVDLIIIAMPSVSTAVIREFVEICRETGAEMKILPGMYQIIDGHVSVNHLRPVQLEDLLHREPVRVDLEEVAGYLRGETVLITGAGGSIGSELCRQVSLFGPQKLILFGHGENSIHKIWLELEESFKGIPLEIEIADVRDRSKVNYIFEKHRPGVVFHAAAHKHVPLMELHPDEAVKTNITGTLNVSDAADRVGVKVFVMISTDKAVNPSSVMGATKRMAELIIQNKNRVSNTIFTAVRFGNVLGSNGSVVPIFQRQIANGGPVTVTHPEMKRYFMTIPESVQLVIQAGAMAEGGEVFVLDMGEPVKIVDLAKDMIKFSGLEPEKDIQITFTGVRPGEKLFEELLTAEEGSRATKHKRIFIARPSLVDVSALGQGIVELFSKGHLCKREDVFAILSSMIPILKRYQREQAG
ncbi:UDP-N-acetylglucosamine 4,6-dehydratase [Desulfocucumis palustris]|uniref:UDP-N-acetylglucosamine 4,6-dehydratase n=2 Tax=Desulfocucumis palustris TaxID=1898651 RepID=A0A2L2XBZ2_9FIRM|nr:UDP-N-acetylglucosamine 4,6-dehydratase [Desulfocucumis palustris]